MQRRIDTIVSAGVTKYGQDYILEGVWDDRPYRIQIFCEYDGRDVDSEILSGDYDPMDDIDFFCFVCEDERFKKTHEEGYKVWETLGDD